MDFSSLSVVGSAKLLLTAVSPIQPFIAKTGCTHEFLNIQALSILQNDGCAKCAGFLRHYLGEINKGVYWADSGWKNVSHYFKPCGKGLWFFSSAPNECENQFELALKEATKYNFAKSAFHLGVAAHLVQDMCVPHHACSKIFSGHQNYENWVEQEYSKYAVNAQGIYNCHNIYKYAAHNALLAADYFHYVNEDATEEMYHVASKKLLALAQKTTAGLFLHYYMIITKKYGVSLIA